MMPTSACSGKALQELGNLWTLMSHNYPGIRRLQNNLTVAMLMPNYQQQLKITTASNTTKSIGFDCSSYISRRDLSNLDT